MIDILMITCNRPMYVELALGRVLQRLRAGHESYESFGVRGCWRFVDEDFIPELSDRTIESLPGGQQHLENLWLQEVPTS